jgi:hypothetical protein
VFGLSSIYIAINSDCLIRVNIITQFIKIEKHEKRKEIRWRETPQAEEAEDLRKFQ